MITAISASYQTQQNELHDLLRESLLSGKERNEVLWSLDAIQIWRKFFEDLYGKLLSLRHRSNPDDPPDLELIFEDAAVGLEHTSLMPYPLGHAEAVAREVNPRGGRSLPSLSTPAS